MEMIQIKICHKQLNYDNLFVNYSIVFRSDNNCTENEKESLACGDYQRNSQYIKLRIDGVLAHYIIKELEISNNYRHNLIRELQRCLVNQLIIKLKPTNKEIIDYKCNEITNYLSWERLEVDHALSWLSTLGGAFSALGDYFPNAAEMAGKISHHQFKLALRLRDPNIQARCRLFLSLSLIQQGYYRIAKNIIYTEFKRAKRALVIDERLVKMCLGIWAKLKYEWHRKRMNG